MEESKLKVYVAGKLNAMAVDYLYNVHKMMEQAEKLRKEDFSVFVPAIDLLMGIKFGYKDYHDYFDNSQPWLICADAIFLTPGWENSEGTKKELETAKKNNIPYFENIDELKIYRKGYLEYNEVVGIIERSEKDTTGKYPELSKAQQIDYPKTEAQGTNVNEKNNGYPSVEPSATADSLRPEYVQKLKDNGNKSDK